MTITYLDQEIESLIQERKPAPAGWRNQILLKPKRGHHEQNLDLAGDSGNEFRLILRRSRINLLDFSVILAVRVPQSNTLFRLRRYNGRSHQHTNRIEDLMFYDFHIHFATERYQELGAREDAYAEPTNRYGDFDGALRCLIEDTNLEVPPDRQGDLFARAGARKQV